MCGPNSDHEHTNIDVGVDLDLDLLLDNNAMAQRNQARLDAAQLCCVNLMSGPGAGKTSLLEQTVAALQGTLRVAVVEGDMTTELDAERLRARGAPVAAITTGRACHLDANLLADGLAQLERDAALSDFSLLFVENVGNLVCPAEFALGEHVRVVLVAVTEGEDKPLKYPLMFRCADCVVITKLDLLPHLRFDIDALQAHIRQINARAPIFALSAETGQGMAPWLEWLHSQLAVHQCIVA
ncbi:MAG: hydrogenase nickel incorporation protein HypB [Chloroflexales bacterium]|nr:hydrogenase nickel incorporation protein HypB [Chloroflexales bacterium]